MNKEIKIFGVGITNTSLKEVLEYFVENAKKDDKKIFVTTVNPEILVHSRRFGEYRKVLNSSDLALPDGIGVVIASKILGKSLKERISGVDLMENVIREVSKEPITVGLLGGRQNVAEEAAERLKDRYPGLKIAFAISEWPKRLAQGKPSEAKSINLKCDILFVAFGHPKQEIWISKNLKKIDVKVAMGVGGAFDYLSGRVMRAPKIVRSLGFEWLFRLIVQPWRIKRHISLIYFVLLILRERFFGR